MQNVCGMVLACLVALAPMAAMADKPELDSSMIIFQDLIGIQWEGHFQNVDESMTLFMSWEPILEGAAVQMNGSSSSSDMIRRNIYYFDRSKKSVCFLAITSNGYVATGTVTREDSVLTFVGKQIGPDGTVRDTKSEWLFLPDGNIRIMGYQLENNNWIPGHKILYTK